jgi:hypothetical protein
MPTTLRPIFRSQIEGEAERGGVAFAEGRGVEAVMLGSVLLHDVGSGERTDATGNVG